LNHKEIQVTLAAIQFRTFCLLARYLNKIKIYKTIILLVVLCMGAKVGLTLTFKCQTFVGGSLSWLSLLKCPLLMCVQMSFAAKCLNIHSYYGA
jgi:hypothetical protein